MWILLLLVFLFERLGRKDRQRLPGLARESCAVPQVTTLRAASLTLSCLIFCSCCLRVPYLHYLVQFLSRSSMLNPSVPSFLDSRAGTAVRGVYSL